MFETLFKQPAVLARYREGPLAEARERFIEHCARQGYSRSMLRKIAWVLLAIAHGIDIDHGKVSAQDIESAVDGRTRFNRRPELAKDASWSRQLFIHFATAWLRSLDCLEQPPEVRSTFATHIDSFARYMREERGLSPVTISTRCDRLAWFFDALRPPRDALRSISISDLDAFIESKGNEGWTRASLSALVGSFAQLLPLR